MFEIYNTETNDRASLAVYYTEKNAWYAIERIVKGIANGQRPDLAGKNFSVRPRLTSDHN